MRNYLKCAAFSSAVAVAIGGAADAQSSGIFKKVGKIVDSVATQTAQNESQECKNAREMLKTLDAVGTFKDRSAYEATRKITEDSVASACASKEVVSAGAPASRGADAKTTEPYDDGYRGARRGVSIDAPTSSPYGPIVASNISCKVGYFGGENLYSAFESFTLQPDALAGKSFAFAGYDAEPEAAEGVVQFGDNSLTITIRGQSESYKRAGGSSCFAGGKRCLFPTIRHTREGELSIVALADDRKLGVCKNSEIGTLTEISPTDAAKAIAAEEAASQKAAAERAAALAAGKPAPRLNAAGLPLGGYYNAIYLGEPDGTLDWKSFYANFFYLTYVEEFSAACAAALPADAKEFTHYKNVYAGSDITPMKRTDYYKTVRDRTIRMKPEMHQRYVSGLDVVQQNLLSAWVGSGMDVDPAALMKIVNQYEKDARKSHKAILEREGCATPTIKAFETRMLNAIK